MLEGPGVSRDGWTLKIPFMCRGGRRKMQRGELRTASAADAKGSGDQPLTIAHSGNRKASDTGLHPTTSSTRLTEGPAKR